MNRVHNIHIMHLGQPVHHITSVIHDGDYAKIYGGLHVQAWPDAPYTGVITAEYTHGFLSPTSHTTALKVWHDPRDVHYFQRETEILLEMQQLSPELFLKAHYAQLHLSKVDENLTISYVLCLERAYAACDQASALVLPADKEAFALRFTADLARSLEVLHNAGYIHGDIKPDNIFIVSDVYDPAVSADQAFVRYANGGEFRAVLGDFDTVQKNDSFTNLHVGTKYYKAPELVMKIQCTAAIDIWSFSVCIFEMLTGQELFGCGDRSSSQPSGDFQERAAKSAVDEIEQLEAMVNILGDIPPGCVVSEFHAGCTYGCLTCGRKARKTTSFSAPLTMVSGGFLEKKVNDDHTMSKNYPRFPAHIDTWWSVLCSGGLQFDPKKRCSVAMITAMTNIRMNKMQSCFHK